jgi:hypothetical protein
MMNLLAITLAVLCAQDTKTVVRQEKGEYNTAVLRYKEAEGLVQSDPSTAVEQLTAILGNSKLRFFDCILKIEQRPGDYTEHPFFPYQARGLARINLAAKATPENAQKHLQLAIDDLGESTRRNNPAADNPLKNAQASLAKLKADVTKPPDTVKADPVQKFREKWDPLMRNNRFKAAKAVIEKESDGLTDELKKDFLKNTEEACRVLLTRWVADFRPQFVNAMAFGQTLEEFEILFKLPPAEEMIVSHPVVDWASQYKASFADVQSQKAAASTLVPAAVASAPLEERFENPYFKAVEAVIFGSLRTAIGAEVDNAREASKVDRDKARAKADGLLAQWKGFTGKLDAKFVDRHKGFLSDHERQLVKLFEGFPAELADLDKLDKAVETAFGAESPDADLAKIEESLSKLESNANLSRESRQLLYTNRVTVAALRGLFSGKTEEAVAADLSSFGQKLREAGGAAGDLKKFGPRVEKVFAVLLR